MLTVRPISSPDPQHLRFEVSGSLTAAETTGFKSALEDALASPFDRIQLDMGQVEFVDSSGLGALVHVLKKTGDQRSLELVNLNPPVRELLKLTRLDRVLTILDDRRAVA